ncbi:MAG: BMC domain-containing protein [Ardenticatenales bacterium]|nr:BMC domain-containing protein [Ardenticatenales bacterium]
MNAIALLEFETVTRGLVTADAIVKRAPLALLRCGTVHPGHYLILIGGDEGAVEEALIAGREVGGDELRDIVHLPNVHADVLASLAGVRRPAPPESLGIIETATVPAAIAAADAALKGVDVALIELRLADGLHGKGIVLLGGALTEVEAAVELALGALTTGDQLVSSAVLTRVAPELVKEFTAASYFGQRVRDEQSGHSWSRS